MGTIPDGTARRATPQPSRGVQGTGGGAVGLQRAAQSAKSYANVAGSGLMDAGQNLNQYAQKIQSRDDVIARARDVTAFNSDINKELWRIQDEEDMSLNDTGKKFNDFVSKRRQEIIGNHSGTPDSRASLEARLTLMGDDFATKSAVMGLNAKQAIVTETMTQSFNGLAASVYENPGNLREAYDGLERQIGEMAPAMNAEEEEYWKGQLSNLPIAAVQSFLDKGGYDEAEKVLDTTPGLKETIPAAAQLKMRGKIEALRSADIASKAASGKKLRDFEAIMGRKATPEERTRIGKTLLGPQSLAEKVEEFERVTGQPASPEHVAKMAGAASGETLESKISAFEEAQTAATGKPYKATEKDVAILAGAYRAEAEGNMFGGGVQGKSLAMITDLEPLITAGTATEDQVRQWESATTEYTQPRQVQNKETGAWEMHYPQLPPFAQRAMAASQGEAEAPEVTEAPTEAFQPPAKTIWGSAEKATGPVPAIGEALRKTPIIGEFVGSSEMTQARTFVGVAGRELIKNLQNNPRFAEGERKAIEEEIKIAPEIFDTPAAFRDRSIAVDDALALREKDAAADMQNEAVTPKERMQARDAFNAISQFREKLGVPPRVYAAEGDSEHNAPFQKLNPGQEFLLIRPDGTTEVRTKGPEQKK